MRHVDWNFEQDPHEATDETGGNLRACFDRMPDNKMREHFKDDGALFQICSERDVEIAEYRKVLEECIRYRVRVGA